MKFWGTLLILLSCLGNIQAQDTLSVLFVGNSYTYYNTGIYTHLKAMANADGNELIYDNSTPGGQQFVQHVVNNTTLNKIAAGPWDYVVLQEQSQKPSFPPAQVATDVYPYAETLVDSIRSANACAEPVFFMTWGRENGDASNCASYPPLCTYEGMQQRLRESYMEMGDDNSSTVAPVGVAWKRVRELNPTLSLYSADGSHPSLAGTYLATCVFYATLYQESPKGVAYYGGLATADAQFLQAVADTVVFDSLDLWNVNGNAPVADFTTNQPAGLEVEFSNSSSNATAWEWDFGDGNTSTDADPTHTYLSDGAYTVQLVALSECATDTFEMELTVGDVTGIEEMHESDLKLFPNPARNKLVVQLAAATQERSSITITDLSGRTVYEQAIEQSIDRLTIAIDQLQTGMYLFRLQQSGTTSSSAFMKH